MSRSSIRRGWATPILLVGMVLTSAAAIVATGWTEHLELVPIVGAGGLVAGLLLGVSTFPDWLTHLFSTLYGLTWTTFLVGRTFPGDLVWRERVVTLGTRVSTWIYQAFTGGIGQDSLIFLLFLSALFWVLGYNAAWNTYRRPRPWVATVPIGILLIVVTHYYTGSAPLIRYVGLYLLLALLYVGQAHTLRQTQVWRRERVAYDPTLSFNVLRSSLLLAVAVIALAWTLPGTSSPSTSLSETWQRLSTPWETVEEEWRRLFSSVHGEPLEVADPLDSTLSLAGPSALEDTLVFDVEAPGTTRYYWRTSVYAFYDGRQWRLPPGEEVPLGPGERVGTGVDDASRRTVTQTVTNYLPGRRLMVAASQPVSFGREASALVQASRSPLELYRASSVLPLGAGDQYSVTSRLSEASGTALRQAGTDYPDWVRQVYLQLPSSLPERVRTLAETITADGDTPYDRARLLERHLRQNITYDRTPPAFPAGRDYVDFLLFESQAGYCNGYASAMVVMARSVGIPARLASGYGEGEYDVQRNTFRVRENNGHSWPEVYFPDYGWIEFEPTASQDPLNRPEPDPASPAEDPLNSSSTEAPAADPMLEDDRFIPKDDDAFQPPTQQPSRTPASWPRSLTASALTVSLLAALVTAGWWAAENWGLRRFPAVERDYARLLRFGRWLGRPLRGPDTPLEWMHDFATIVPQAREQMGRIVELHAIARFGRGDPRDPAADRAWRRARALLWRHLLWDQWLRRLGFLSPQCKTGD